MQDLLEVERQQEEHREADCCDHDSRRIRGRERAQAEHPQGEKRRLRAKLDQDEHEDEEG